MPRGSKAKHFKEFVESRPTETGVWRGEIHGGNGETGKTDKPQSGQM